MLQNFNTVMCFLGSLSMVCPCTFEKHAKKQSPDLSTFSNIQMNPVGSRLNTRWFAQLQKTTFSGPPEANIAMKQYSRNVSWLQNYVLGQNRVFQIKNTMLYLTITILLINIYIT